MARVSSERSVNCVGTLKLLSLPGKSLWTEAYFMTGLYTLALLAMFVGYYGLHSVFYGV